MFKVLNTVILGPGSVNIFDGRTGLSQLIQPVIEHNPFEQDAMQNFFIEWCKRNDSIQPDFIDRKEMEQRAAKGAFGEAVSGKRPLFIPKDLKLWEMPEIVEAIDHDTFSDNPARQSESKEGLAALGRHFQGAGIYIAKRLDAITNGRSEAKKLSRMFYEYGNALLTGKKFEGSSNINDIAAQTFNPSDLEEIDRFLAGAELYNSRRARAEKAAERDPSQREEIFEAERKRTLAGLFRAIAKVSELEEKGSEGILRKDGTGLKPWQSDAPVHRMFFSKVADAIVQKIEEPEVELTASIFRRGMELLRKNMPCADGKATLRETLRIDRSKQELEELRKSGVSADIISEKEMAIANRIQRAISKFPYQDDANNPAEIVVNGQINCVGASMLGGALMQEMGLNYLVAAVPEHITLFLVTDTGRIWWSDMLNDPLDNFELTDEMIEGRNEDGSRLTAKDIAAFGKRPSLKGLRLNSSDSKKYVFIFGPEYGQKLQALNNMGNYLADAGKIEGSLLAYQQAVASSPRLVDPYNGLGINLCLLSFYNEEAIEIYRQSIAIDPNNANIYNSLGNAFNNLQLYKKAAETYRHAIDLDPKFAGPHNGLGDIFSALGRHREAIESYQKFIELIDKEKYASWIARAEIRIEEEKDAMR